MYRNPRTPYPSRPQRKWQPCHQKGHRHNARNGRHQHTKECWNCGDPTHLLDRCPKPRDLAAIANRRYRRYNREYAGDQPRVLRRILYEITSQFPADEGLATTDKETEESDTEGLFEQSEEYSTLFCTDDTPSDEAPQAQSTLFTLTDSAPTDPVPDPDSAELQLFDICHTRSLPVTHAINYSPPESTHHDWVPQKFQGACLDIGAEKSVIGLPQATAYRDFANSPIIPRPTNNIFRFGESCFPSIGTIRIALPSGKNDLKPLTINIVDVDVPFLLGLDELDNSRMYVDNVDNLLRFKDRPFSLPLTRKLGHIYLTWNLSQTLFNRTELRKLHLHFFHPSSSKLFSLVSRAHPNHATPETRKIIENISKRCDTCQRFSPKPLSFSVTAPDDVKFNSVVSMDLMYLDRHPVLHVIDLQTNFSSAVFLANSSVETVWNAFLLCWTTIYTGYPEKIKVDQGSVFTSEVFKQLSKNVGLSIDLSGVESHNSLGSGEK